MKHARHVLTLLAIAFSLITISSLIGTVSANIPTVIQIDNVSQGSSGKIRLQITHLNPSSTHYVDVIEVDVNGQVTQFNQQPQTTDPFTVELDLGQLQGNPTIRARAHCTKHGWSSWSSQIQVPEFSEMGTAVVVVALVCVLLTARKTTKKRLPI